MREAPAHGAGWSSIPSRFRRSHWRRFHFCNFAHQVRLTCDAFEVRITLSAVIVDFVRLKKIFILDEQFNRFVAARRLPDRRVEIL